MRDRLRFEHELRDLEEGEREIIGGDTRKKVKDSIAIPFRFICHLAISYKDTREKAAGTGILIGPRHVLTAAHNLHTVAGLKARRVVVSPARNGEPNSIGGLSTKTWNIHRFWDSNKTKNWNFDYALIRLDDEVGSETYKETDYKPLGYWGDSTNGGGTLLRALDPVRVDGQVAYVAGYPELDEPNNYFLYCGRGKVFGHLPNQPIKAEDLVMQHTVDTSDGQSGAPVWIVDPFRCLVGLHIRPGRTDKGKYVSNFAIRITPTVIAQLQTWMKT